MEFRYKELMTESGMMKTEFLMGIWIMQMNPSLLSTKTERSGTGTEILQNRQQKKIPITLQKILPVQKISVIPLICTAGMREPVSISRSNRQRRMPLLSEEETAGTIMMKKAASFFPGRFLHQNRSLRRITRTVMCSG